VYGEPDGYVNASGKRISAEDERKEIVESIRRNGCAVVSAWFRPSEDAEWEMCDSVGMCIYCNPTDPLQNCYVTDLMRAAIDAVNAASLAPRL
jgi:hypothetical protein